MTDLVLLQTDDRNTFDVDVDQVFSLNLSETPTSGFLWRFEIHGGLIEVANDYVGPIEHVFGGGGHRIVRLRATAPGEGRIIATLDRPWHTGSPPRAVCEFTLHVR